MTSARERREGPRPSRLRGFSGFLTRRPRLALASWVVLVVVLALVGNDLAQTIVVSPWSAGTAIEGLRPKPGVAGVVVRVGHRSDEALEEMLELVEGQVE